ncbi:MAG: hypothetical protein ABFC24_01320 [Methanoregulaceae archaeon]
MIQLSLNENEAATLRVVLEQYIPDLRMEIADTEKMEYRELLKEREGVLKKILELLPK